MSDPAAGDILRFGIIAQKLIENMPLGVMIFDRQLEIADSNPFAANLLAAEGNLAQILAAGSESESAACWAQRIEGAIQSQTIQVFDHISYTRRQRNLVLRLICTPLAMDDGPVVQGGILLIEDMTAQTALAKDLAAAERLAAVGKLAASVAHELNNPLDGILRYINLAIRLTEDGQPQQVARYLRESRKGLQRMVQIVSELLEFSRSSYSAFQEADINKIVEEAVKTLETQAAEQGVQIVRQYAAGLPTLRSGNLFQVFCNLIKNAVDAMSGGGRLEVSTRLVDHTLRIEFADSGPGLAPEVLDKLFEPFFTTKPAGKGTGLGLSICKDIVERYNGQILVENRPTGGSRFAVCIPLEPPRPESD
ncbi:MAG: GHKL domain-containing protein [Sedimentisphaerales bacterium]|nr:GHKL domain-containing protein [Sedimentisphaerales bacterium]